MVATCIDLDDIGRGRFDAFLGRDKIVSGSKQPALDACRVLKALGITGTLEVFHAGSSVVAMRLDIERAAGLTVIESVKYGPKFAPWHPYDPATHEKAIGASASEQGAAFP
ncbi:hypothetical protein [Hyphomicrobium sp. MC1]|uniref:hypothetical protein n=1 Tax=Hyphomicrobium sp. (strain MC1) TaxID=717785 RepID=UPI000213EAC5|nr:hypothetical protein [Hyphomicrobium sp. MC1]CCB64060.1 protein of unknown function [Hyphomicrobium sp. MC1]